MTKEKFYVVLDAMGIQDYVFKTNRLKVILGASLCLARWQYSCKKKIHFDELISSAGGNVFAVFNNKAEALKFKEGCIGDAPPGLEIAWAMEKMDSVTINTVFFPRSCRSAQCFLRSRSRRSQSR